VAVVPIRHQETVVGALHLADEQPGLFPGDIVEFLEAISPLVGEAAHRFYLEDQLRKSEERYRSLVIATTQIVWTTNAQGEVGGDLPAWRQFTGQSLEGIQGWGWIEALHPEDRQRVAAGWTRAAETRSLYQTEYRVRRADGEYRHFAVCGAPVLEPDGAIREWVGTCTDVTEHRQADEQLRAVNESLVQRALQLRALAAELTLAEERERRRLAQILHDELQQLLVAAKFSVNALYHRSRANPALQGDLQGVESLLVESIRASRTLVVQLNPPALTEYGLATAMHWLGEEMKRLHDLAVHVTADSEVPADAEGVAVLLFQAVRELLFNVVKHAGVKSATVQIHRLTGNQVQIVVADEGAGFDLGAAPRTTDSPTGLGLFGIQERISHMGGRMQVESAPGRGTRVTLVAEIRPPETAAGKPPSGGDDRPAGEQPAPRRNETAAGTNGMKIG
jgi:PAS domain S-box-containing protein